MLFTDNKYTRLYYRIVEQRKANRSTDPTERHHIIPKSLGGSDDPDNLVALTLREHFICHLLLTKMVEHPRHRYAMTRASRLMAYTRDIKINSRIYSIIGQHQPTPDLVKDKISKSKKGKCSWADDKDRVEKHRLQRIGKKHPEKRCKNMSKGMLGKNSWTYEIEGTTYDSNQVVAEKYGLHRSTVRKRCRSPNFPEWRIVDKIRNQCYTV
jgi:hypothetical protein